MQYKYNFIYLHENRTSEKTKMTSCHAFLFNDLLLFTKPGKNYSVLTAIDLHKTRIVDPSEYGKISFLFL